MANGELQTKQKKTQKSIDKLIDWVSIGRLKKDCEIFIFILFFKLDPFIQSFIPYNVRLQLSNMYLIVISFTGNLKHTNLSAFSICDLQSG